MKIFNKQKTLIDWGRPDARIHLRLVNFDMQSVVSVERILQELNKIPSYHLGGLKEIRYDPSRESQTWVDNSLTMNPGIQPIGMYLQGFRTIAVYNFNSEKQLFTVLFHELGHYVYYTILDSTVKKKWVTDIHPEKKYVSRYASRNASEDFAESYAEFLLNPENLQTIPNKYNFIRNEVFNRIAYHRSF